MQKSCGTLVGIAFLALSVGGCGSDADEPAASASGDAVAASEPAVEATDPTVSATDQSAAPVTGLEDGPVTLIALGDSLTAGDGDDAAVGYVGRLAESIGAAPGRSDVSVVNLGASGWDSTTMVDGQDGQDGSPGQLGAALDAVEAAVAEGRAVLATVLIGSNDLWYLYEYGPPEGTPPANEAAAEETYRSNLDRTVRELSQAGAVVVLGLPDDQSLRPGVADIDQLHNYLPSVTVDEVQLMAAMAERLGRVTEDVAAAHGVRTVDTNAPFWSDESKMADDGIHPNGDGYADLAALWLTEIQDLL